MILKARVLVDKFFTQPAQIVWVRATPASVVDLNLRPPSWLRWIKSFDAVLNWSLSPITFLMSLPTVLRRTICQDCWQWTLFYFIFIFLSFLFLFLEQLRLGLIGHAVTSVTSWWQSHKTDHEAGENLVEDSKTNDIIQHGHHMLTSWTTHGCLG